MDLLCSCTLHWAPVGEDTLWSWVTFGPAQYSYSYVLPFIS